MKPTENPLTASLLRAFGVIAQEKSVTRAAQKLGISQPALSLLLKQLRTIFDDPLFVRADRGMVLTERAAQLRDSIAKSVSDLDGLLLRPDEFNPAMTRSTFTIAMPDHILPGVMSEFVQEFRQSVPLAKLELRALGPDYDFEQALATGEADVVISNWPTPPQTLRQSMLFEDEFVCLVDKDHDFTRYKPTMDEYLHANHIAPADYAIAQRGVVETHLTSLRIQRERRVVISYFSMAPYLLVGTDLVFTVTRHFAEHFTGFLPLKIIDCPVEFPKIHFYQLWHERSHHSPAHKWLRSTISKIKRVQL